MGTEDGKKESVWLKVVLGILGSGLLTGALTSFGTAAYYKPKAEGLEKALNDANSALAAAREREKNPPVDPVVKQTQETLSQCKTDLNRVSLIKNDALSAEISRMEMQQVNDVKAMEGLQIIAAPLMAGVTSNLPPDLAIQAAFLQRQIDSDFAAISDMRSKFEYAASSSSPTTDQKGTP